jgi:catechol 2,3-dioxygenase-like lactoylglutathione lyase family enzyme
MLDNARVATRLPTQDLNRARRFYAEKLGLEPTEERPGGLRYQFANGEFALYGSAGHAWASGRRLTKPVQYQDTPFVRVSR